MQTIRVASRSSRLALTQSQQVLDEIVLHNPQIQFEIVEVKTRGDQGDLSKQGAFTNAIEQALVDERADMAIHSYKDLPTQTHEALCIAAVPQRADARDVLISEKYNGLSTLPDNAIIGTGSPRRKAQLQAINPNWKIEFINGNIDTRIQKLRTQQYDSIILAAAGLVRMGWQNQITEYLLPTTMIPAPAQGALAIQCRKNDEPTIEICQAIHSENTAYCVHIERKILSGIGGGCQLPIGAFVHIEKGYFTLDALFGILENNKLNKLHKKASLQEIEEITLLAINELTKHRIT